MNKNLLAIPFLVLLQITCLAAFAQSQSSPKPSLNVEGKWQLSWQARIGTERGGLSLQRNGTKLNGSFHSELGSPAVSGTIEDENISFKLQFEGVHPFAIVFTGKVEQNKMNGKFAIDGMMDGYDQHGENVQPTNYSWSAIRPEIKAAQTDNHAVQTP
ncbi:MAG TPA: hypothetical protein VH079_18525 [Terriglobales bacterium]|jgi:autotransporter translocation and assembly factor TamB|nr:hypothetical protein [Terriglobales bacterium]